MWSTMTFGTNAKYLFLSTNEYIWEKKSLLEEKRWNSNITCHNKGIALTQWSNSIRESINELESLQQEIDKYQSIIINNLDDGLFFKKHWEEFLAGFNN